MATEFRLPELGENIDSADVLKVLVSEGDKVEVDQVVMEIETDKATIEVPSEVSGIVKKVHVKEGTKAKVGEVILTVDSSGAGKMEDGREKMENGNVEETKVEKAENKPVAETKNIETKREQTSKPKTGLYEFKIPNLGENIETADVTKVHVAPGDKVEVDQIVLEIETDKATVEVPSEVSGVVKDVKVKDGQKVNVGDVMFTMESASLPEEKKEEPQKPVQVASPKEKPVQQETEVDISEYSKVPREIDEIKHEFEDKTEEVKQDISQSIAPAAPTVRRFAREIGIDIHKVRGSGPGGRISIEDVKKYAKNLNEQISTGAIGGIAREPLPDFSKWGSIERQPMSNVRRKTAEHLSYAWATIPHVTQFDKADITELENLRKQFGEKVEEAGGKLTVTAILLKVIASGMKVFPQFNSSVDMEKNEIVYKKYYNLGVAVDTDRGLLVPVIRNVDKKNIVQLSVELAEVSQRARDKKLSLEDMQGGCFTISNLGGIGGTYFTPIVNSPEVAILGVSRSAYEQVYINGKFEPRLMMPLSLSYDHRIIDGADAIRFLRWIVGALENPFLLSLEG